MKKIFLSLVLIFVFLPFYAKAQEGVIEISPSIIDEKAKAGDILKYDITIVNKGDRKADIYAIVNDILEADGKVTYGDPQELSKDTSITRWLTFKRGVIELLPGATTTIPLEINISGTAQPGKRFARLALPIGSNRQMAEGGASGATQIPINIEIYENVIEKAQIKEFSVTNKVFIELPFVFNLKLENNGNKEIAPIGNIYIYNRRGEEVSSLDINPDSENIPAEGDWIKQLNLDKVEGMGKFKAKAEIEYGSKDKRDLQDTLYFWYFPWQFLLIVFAVTFLLLATIVTLIFKKTFVHHHEPIQASPSVRIRKTMPPSKDIINLKK